MKIRNTTTGQLDDLIYAREPHNTINFLDDPAIVFNKETEEREANQETIDWWSEYLSKESEYQDLYEETVAGMEPQVRDSLDDELNNVISGCEYGEAPSAGITYLKNRNALKELIEAAISAAAPHDAEALKAEIIQAIESGRDIQKMGVDLSQESEPIGSSVDSADHAQWTVYASKVLAAFTALHESCNPIK